MQKLHTNSQNSSFQIWQNVHIGQIKVYKHPKGLQKIAQTATQQASEQGKVFLNNIEIYPLPPPRDYLFVFRVFLVFFSVFITGF